MDGGSVPGGVADLSEFVGRVADERLLDDQSGLPESERFTERRPEAPARRSIVGAGAALTGLSLVCGAALVLLGVVLAAVNGIGAFNIVLMVVGAALVATHWGWVHVAEFTANALGERVSRDWHARRAAWLASLEPYSRWSVTTAVLEDGSIRIECRHHRPVRVSDRTFGFETDLVESDVHGPDELSAVVAERAETMRRQAALNTNEQERLWRIASDAYAAELGEHADAEERRRAQVAASKALSDQINAKLGEPPLIE